MLDEGGHILDLKFAAVIRDHGAVEFAEELVAAVVDKEQPGLGVIVMERREFQVEAVAVAGKAPVDM